MIQLFAPKYETEEILLELRHVFNSGWTGTGPKCSEFERVWSEFITEEPKQLHSVFVNSGTAALQIALRLLDLPKRSKVATTPITFVSTSAVILYEGLEPVFCDVDLDGSLQMMSVRKAIEDGANAVIWVHYGGSVSKEFYGLMYWLKATRRDTVTVIEDCAHAAGACYEDGSRVGSRTDTISCFSFHSVKNLPIFDGGMISVRSQAELERALRLSWLGIDKNTYTRTNEGSVYKWMYDVPELGWKFNGNDIAATIGLVQLRHLDRDNAFRRQIHQWYNDSPIALIKHEEGSSCHLASIAFNDSDERNIVMAALKARDIAPGVHYRPNFEFPMFASFYQQGQCPIAESFAKTTLSLPNHLRLKKTDIEFIARTIDQCFH